MSLAKVSSERADNFERLRKNIPNTGDMLEPLDGISAKVFRDNKGGKQSVYVNACINSEATAWKLCNDSVGLKCLICKEQHDKVGETLVKLRVLRRANSDKAIICELVE